MSAYEVLARKYRPQAFEEVLGQEAVATALKNAVVGGRTSHAYLFAGPRGVGKTSMARILSKALNCEQGPTPTPCNQCDICKDITSGSDLDVLEIDGASNNSVDDVRRLRENVRYVPNRARYRIYYIDEVHMLSQQAFNALLKTLEEPPPHVKFIFSTTDPQRLPATIHSRCQRFDFRNVPVDKIVARLREICSQEGIEAEADVLDALARRAQGSMRDAQVLLDQLASFAQERITTRDMQELLGTIPEDEVFAVVDAWIGGDVAGALGVVERAAEHSWDLRELLSDLVAHLRDLVVLVSAGPDSILLRRSEAALVKLTEQAKQFNVDLLLYMLRLLAEAKSRLQGGLDGQVAVELVMAKLARLGQSASLEEILGRLDKLEGKLATGGEFRLASSARARGLFDVNQGAVAVSAENRSRPDLSQVKAHWHELIDKVRESDVKTAPALEACRPQQVWSEEIVAVLPARWSSLRERLSTPDARRAFKSASEKVLGFPMALKIAVEAEPAEPESKPGVGASPELQGLEEKARKVEQMFEGETIK